MYEINYKKYNPALSSRAITSCKNSSFDANAQKNDTSTSNTQTSEAATNGFRFGTNNAAPKTSGATTSGIGFGSLNKSATSTAGSLFGGASTETATGGFGFGQAATSSAPSTGFGTGATGSTFSFGSNNTTESTGTFIFRSKPGLLDRGTTSTTGTKSFSFGTTRESDATGATELSTNTFGTCNAFSNIGSSKFFDSFTNYKSAPTATENSDEIIIDPKTNVNSKALFSDLPPSAQKLIHDVEQYKSQQKSISDGLKSVIEETRKSLDGCHAKFKNTESQTSNLEQDLKSEESQDKVDELELNEKTKDLQQTCRNVNRLQNEYAQLAEIEGALEYFSKTSKTLEQHVNQALETLKLLNQQIYTLNQSKADSKDLEAVQETIQPHHTVNNNLTDKVLSNHQSFSSETTGGSDATEATGSSISTFETSSILANNQAPEVSSDLNISKSTSTVTENSDEIIVDPKTNANSKALFSDLPPSAQKLIHDVEQYKSRQKSISDGLKSVIEETRKSLDGCHAKFKNTESQTSNLEQDLKSEESQDKADGLELNEKTKDLQQTCRNVNRLQNEYAQLAEIEGTLEYFSKTSKTLEQHVNQALETLKLLNQQINILNQSKTNQNASEEVQEDIQSQYPVVIDLTDEVGA